MNEAAPAIPVVSYARISADTARDGHGVEDQHKANGETAARLGWTIVHRYTDNDLSAAKAAVVRPDFEAMVKALKSGHMPDGQPVRGVIVVARSWASRSVESVRSAGRATSSPWSPRKRRGWRRAPAR